MIDNKRLLSNQERQQLYEIHLGLSDKKDADRVKVIILLDKGWSTGQIQEALLLNKRTIYRYRDLYKTGGIDSLLENRYHGGFCKLSEEEKEILKKELETKLYPNAKEICAFVEKRFGKIYTSDGLVPLLHAIGFSYKKTKKVPGKANPDEQAVFKKEYEKRRKTQKKGEKAYFLDGVHPTHNMMPDYAWIRTGEEYFIKSNDGRKRINILGLYSPDDHDIIVQEYKTIDADAVINILKKLENMRWDGETIWVYTDNARYNHSKKVKEYLTTTKVKLVYLPAYSPNLNLIERLWRLLKRSVIANTYYEHFDDFRVACMRYLRRRDPPFKKTLDRLMTENFQTFPAKV
ncbi:MAG: hypothetical protein A2096_14740 [Spirochaetes bacterium GWF1_41_5]|nr:MAG: hypothetical protein A2096_14740 [Spirochaetes bacterium GWF1_41_5]